MKIVNHVAIFLAPGQELTDEKTLLAEAKKIEEEEAEEEAKAQAEAEADKVLRNKEKIAGSMAINLTGP